MTDLEHSTLLDRETTLARYGLAELTRATSGSRTVRVAVLDGPVDLSHPAFADIALAGAGSSPQCKAPGSVGCEHGTAVLGVLAAARGSRVPGLCPGCTFLIAPFFGEAERSGPVPIAELAHAVRRAVTAGADILNLSVGMSDRARRLEGLGALHDAYDFARQCGTLIVAAAGNFGHVGHTPLIDHPWVIPVAAAGPSGGLHARSNAGQRVGRQGLLAPGSTLSTSSGARYAPFSGTSAAAPFVAGAAALLLSLFPGAPRPLIRFALLRSTHGRRSIIPPPLDGAAALQFLRKQTLEASSRRRFSHMTEASTAENLTAPAQDLATVIVPGDIGIVPAGGGTTCGCNAAAATPVKEEPPTYVYALGTIRAEWSSQSAKKEYAQVAADQRVTGSESQVLYEVLRANHYLAREACWIFSVEKQDIYQLVVRESDIDALIAAIEPRGREDDQDMIVGTRGPVRTCGAFTLPLVLADRVVTFNRSELFQLLKVPEGMEPTQFQRLAEDLFGHVRQFIDNVGVTDRDRAYNYLLTRYPQVYGLVAEKQQQGMRFDGLETQPSRLSESGGRLVNVVFKFSDRSTEAPEKYYVRVDVSGKYPFLASRLAPFYDR
jgi:hypothetical protein